MFKYFIVLILGFTLMSCKGQKSGASTTTNVSNQATEKSTETLTTKINIDIVEAKKMMEANKDIVLIDVRTPEEIARGKINNALEMNISSPEFTDKINKLDKSKEYIVYCAVGGRSATAVSMMQQVGFTKVHNLAPGYVGWSRQ
ncbi:MAG: rhodanese-like domain-containing protein [Saprospiraceae bacterium]|jgi:rhodanese-related sulfurtransferase|nr:rhodanese-like domain-containing protein [Saprospiraceae bacterium]